MQAIERPLELPCGGSLPNRLVKAAMTEGLADTYNRATPAHATLYRRWSNGGAGLLLTGNIQVDRRGLERPGNVVIEGLQSPDQRTALERWTKAGRIEGNHIWAQLSHAGRQTPKAVNPEPLAPSAISLRMPGGQFGKPRALKEKEIEEIIDRFAYAAVVCRECGFTGVQIHAAHGYLISELLSPRTNRRTDAWGGLLENRARMLLETVQRVRNRVGEDFPISVKLNSADFQKGGFTSEECVRVVGWLAELEIDLLEISGGTYEQPRMVGIDGLEPVFEDGVRASTKKREAYFLDYARRVREAATMPLLVTGGFRTRSAMNAAIEEDGIGAIGLARPLCVMPDAPGKLLDGALDELPTWERRLRVGPWLLGPTSPIDTIRALNGWGIQSWFCLQILRMGRGVDPDTSMGVLRALMRYQSNEREAARQLREHTSA